MKGKTVLWLLLVLAVICCGCGRKKDITYLPIGTESELTEARQETGLELSVAGGQELHAGVPSIKLLLHNGTDSKIRFGREIEVFLKSGNEWQKLKWKDGATILADYMEISASADYTISLDYESLYGAPLKEGTYRVVKNVWKNDEKVSVTAEFTVLP